MLVAPFSVPPSRGPRRLATQRRSVAASSKAAMAAWFAAGVLAIVAIPAARGDAMLGATLPFWLVVAPAINLLWIERRRWTRALVRLAQRRFARASSRNVRRQRAPRSLACSAARS